MRTAGPEAAVVFFVNRNGELLLRLRDDGPLLPHPGRWDTIGGAQEPGETPAEALEREVKEEIGLDLTDGTFWRDQQGDVLLHIYAAPLDKTAGLLHLTEGQRVAWFGPEDAAVLQLVPWVAAVLTDFTRSDLYALLATGSPLGLTNGCQAKDYREGSAAP